MGKVVDQIAAVRSRIGLVDYALEQGWVKDREKSSNRATVLRNGASGKLLVWEKEGGRYDVWYDLREERHGGDVVDFVMWDRGISLQEALEALGGYETPPLPSGLSKGTTGASRGNRSDVVKYWSEATWKARHGYLRRRGLNDALDDARFVDCYRMDGRGNACFPHVDRQGVCGVEKRNVNFKGMQTGSIKGLWLSGNIKSASEILIAESPIDCLSHFELGGGDFAYCSLGGQISEYQFELVRGLIFKAVNRKARIVVGTDNDSEGEKYYHRLQSLSSVVLRRDLSVRKDWNADLTYARNEA